MPPEIMQWLGVFGQYGGIVTALIVAFRFTDMGKSIASLEKTVTQMKADFVKQLETALEPIRKDIAELESRMNAGLDSVRIDVEAVRNRLSCVETEYLSKEEFYRTFSGWREEFRALNERIDRILERDAGVQTPRRRPVRDREEP